MIELNEELKKFAIILIKSNKAEISRMVIWLIEKVYLEQVNNNLPDEKNIWLLNWGENKEKEIKETDSDNSNQWDEISTGLLYILNSIINHAIELRETELICTGLRAFTYIASEISSSTLGDKMKLSIIQNCFYYAKSLTIEISKLNLINNSLSMIPFDCMGMDRILEPSREYSKYALMCFGTTFIELAKTRQLPYLKLNDIGATGRFCMSKIEKSDFLKDATIYLTNVLIKLFEIYEKDNDQEKDQFLLEIYNQTESIMRWFKGDPVKHEKLLKTLDERLSQLKKVDSLLSKKSVNVNWTEIA